MSQSNNDCYFYYNSTCSKGDMCPFRHEPTAINQETVCNFWMQGNCRNFNCSFRHMQMEKKRSQIPCFWEAQPTGCSKGNCPFMHVKIKHDDPYVPEAVVPATIFPINGGGKIIVNKNRLDQIALSNPEVASAAIANRTVLPPGGGSARKIPIKQRLGYKMEESNEFDDYSGEIDSEEESLRKGAISTIDLRKRLTSKRRHSSSDGSADIEPEVKIRSVVKKVKKEKKEKKKQKKEKRAKREESKINRASKKNNQDFSGEDSDNDTLAQRIAAQRDKNKKGAKNSSNDHGSKKRGSTPERSVKIVDKKSPNNSDSKTKKSKAARKTSLNEEKDSVRSVIDDVDALLKSSDHVLPLSDSSAKNDSHDVMKELDELINS